MAEKHEENQPPTIPQVQSAIQEGNLERVRLLVKRLKKVKNIEKDINIQDRNGWTVLMAAAIAGFYDICEEILLIKGCDPNICNQDGNSVLHYLARKCEGNTELYAKLFKILVTRGGDVS